MCARMSAVSECLFSARVPSPQSTAVTTIRLLCATTRTCSTPTPHRWYGRDRRSRARLPVLRLDFESDVHILQLGISKTALYGDLSHDGGLGSSSRTPFRLTASFFIPFLGAWWSVALRGVSTLFGKRSRGRSVPLSQHSGVSCLKPRAVAPTLTTLSLFNKQYSQ